MVKLTDYHVKQIRTQRLTDRYWSMRLRVTARTIRDARVGKTYQHVEALPDIAPREGGGRLSVLNPAAKPARVRRQWL